MQRSANKEKIYQKLTPDLFLSWKCGHFWFTSTARCILCNIETSNVSFQLAPISSQTMSLVFGGVQNERPKSTLGSVFFEIWIFEIKLSVVGLSKSVHTLIMLRHSREIKIDENDNRCCYCTRYSQRKTDNLLHFVAAIHTHSDQWSLTANAQRHNMSRACAQWPVWCHSQPVTKCW